LHRRQRLATGSEVAAGIGAVGRDASNGHASHVTLSRSGT